MKDIPQLFSGHSVSQMCGLCSNSWLIVLDTVFMWVFILTLFEQKYKFVVFFLEFIVDSTKECVFVTCW